MIIAGNLRNKAKSVSKWLFVCHLFRADAWQKRTKRFFFSARQESHYPLLEGREHGDLSTMQVLYWNWSPYRKLIQDIPYISIQVKQFQFHFRFFEILNLFMSRQVTCHVTLLSRNKGKCVLDFFFYLIWIVCQFSIVKKTSLPFDLIYQPVTLQLYIICLYCIHLLCYVIIYCKLFEARIMSSRCPVKYPAHFWEL